MVPDSFAVRFALASLATWRVTHLLSEEDGPVDAVVRLRARVGDGWPGELMDCFYCLSIWVSAPHAMVVARRPRQVALVWLALSGAACLLERATNVAEPEITPRGVDDELLRQEAEESSRSCPPDAGEPGRHAKESSVNNMEE